MRVHETTHPVPNSVTGWITCADDQEDAAWRDVWQHGVYQLGEPELSGTVVIDVGSNVGFFTAFALHHGAIQVLAVDPVEAHHERSRRMLGDRDDVRYIVGCAGDGVGRTFGPGTGPSQTMVPIATGGMLPVVNGITLDELLDQVRPLDGAPVIVKVDCEGCEFDLIESASDEALRAVNRFTMEWHGQMGALLCSAAGRIGEMVERLIYTHSVTVYGDPQHGGMLYAYRY